LTVTVNPTAAPLTKQQWPIPALLWLLRIWIRLFHRIAISGLENYPPLGESAVVVPNHFSLADGWLLAAFLPCEPVFVIRRVVSERWWARPFLARIPVILVDPLNPLAVRTMIVAGSRDGGWCCFRRVASP
jgi:acyl-[acyl-carrier-protein]-phospholipid O-acyltransferase/long-chain-fatty-acid--[acyl-carrier-protein] ligase